MTRTLVIGSGQTARKHRPLAVHAKSAGQDSNNVQIVRSAFSSAVCRLTKEYNGFGMTYDGEHIWKSVPVHKSNEHYRKSSIASSSDAEPFKKDMRELAERDPEVAKFLAKNPPR